ncbi:MAG: glycosyltransferase family 4 protein [Actinobacteria bacterium]|nr:glycosyltransferase family 4 protein [Actinomycetota bacterium]
METYIRNMLPGLFSLNGEKNEYLVFCTDWNAGTLHFEADNIRKLQLDGGKNASLIKRLLRKTSSKVGQRDLFSSQAKLAGLIQELGVDLLFCPLITLEPRGAGLPSVITIPDIQHEYHPEFFTEEDLANRKAQWKSACLEATRVITISEYSRQCLLDRYQLAADKVHAIPLAVDVGFFNSPRNPRSTDIREKYQISGDYAFYPANLWRHKNHATLLKAFGIFRRRHPGRLRLVFSGFQHGKEDELNELVRELDLEVDVKILGHVPLEDLPGLYRGASFLVFPSLFEGFGFPLIEAMACDCPIVASDVTSIPEVTGDAALLFNPYDPEDIAQAMHRVLTETGLSRSLVERGRKRLRLFSWDKVSSQTLEVLVAAKESGAKAGKESTNV